MAKFRKHQMNPKTIEKVFLLAVGVFFILGAIAFRASPEQRIVGATLGLFLLLHATKSEPD